MIFNRSTLLILACICGLAVANIYYNQPLLVLFIKTFHINPDKSSHLITAVQFAYAVGLIIFVPLGDRLCRKKLIIALLILNSIFSGASAIASNFNMLLIFTIGIGLTSVSAQIIIPAVSLLSPEKNKGENVGIVMSGLFAGIFLARTISGTVGDYYDWRTMYLLAAVIDIFIALIVLGIFPNITNKVKISYLRLIGSLYNLLVTEKNLWRTSICGGLTFGAFSGLWGSLAYLLSLSPYHFNSHLVGLFGLFGIVGVIASKFIGRLVDNMGGRKVVTIGVTLIIISFLLIWHSSVMIYFLILGMIFLDLGSRMSLIGNQLQLLSLAPEIRSRLNTLYMAIYFIGGAIGATIGGAVGVKFGWHGIAIFGLVLALLALVNNKLNY